LPPINDVANQIECATLVVPKKLQERPGLTARRSKVEVGDPYCADRGCCLWVTKRSQTRTHIHRSIVGVSDDRVVKN
jgi:hypothetical protein